MNSATLSYFAYGSNMDPKQIKERLGRIPKTQCASLKDYCLRFNKVDQKMAGVGYANIIHSRGKTVCGVLYEVTEEEMNKIDHYEGISRGHYRRESVEVEIASDNNNRACAIAYIAYRGKIKEGLRPTAEYLKRLLAGRKYLPEEYLKQLEKTPLIERNPDEENNCE
jgi:gamma-glutamylcyclotransferase